MYQKSFFIGVAGGSGSGKTTFAKSLKNELAQKGKSVEIISLDCFYKGKDVISNYDEPNALDYNVMMQCLTALKSDLLPKLPVYDFVNHRRNVKWVEAQKADIYIIESIFTLCYPAVRDLLNISFFVDVDEDEQILRRLSRDIIERGRSLESITEQYLRQVKPGFREYILPSKKYANIIIPGGGHNKIAVDLVVKSLQ